MPSKCNGCGIEFPSRNAIFRHLKQTNGACLSPQEYNEFHRYVLLQDRKKVLLLYGYLILPDGSAFQNEKPWRNCIENGQDAATKLVQTLEEHYLPHDEEKSKDAPKITRSYGITARNVDSLQQDDRTGAITEVMAIRLPAMSMPLPNWLDTINALLDSKGYAIRVFGRLEMSHAKFNAEMDVTHRRVEYLLPADFLLPSESQSLESFYKSLPSFLDGFRNFKREGKTQTSVGAQLEALNEEKGRPNEDTKHYLFKLKKIMQSLATQVVDLDAKNNGAVLEKGFHKKKRKKQCFKSEKRSMARNKQQEDGKGTETMQPKKPSNGEKGTETKNKDQAVGEDSQAIQPKKTSNGEKASKKTRKEHYNGTNDSQSNKGLRVLRRRRFHNFTDSMMAHEFFSFRRMDRMYHRATLRFPDSVYDPLETQHPNTLDRNRPFLVVSISGDLFLHGQICRVMGVLIALARGRIDEDFVDCVFDEDYPHLVPTPQAPSFGMYARDSHYTQWEGKVKKTLSPRKCDKFEDGWHDVDTLRRVHEWEAITREEIAKVWLSKGIDSSSKRLLAEKQWTTDVLEPWLVGAKKQLEDYRQWRNANLSSDTAASNGLGNIPLPLPPLSSIDETIPPMYQKVLKCLREADASGCWPSTTPKRQMVMISTQKDASTGDGDNQNVKNPNMSSLSMAHWVARNNNRLERSSAYSFHEGAGGASGSFSVGAMPGEQCVQPKANELFPDLMRAAFELERALRPDREPSSTIAINRNAQVSWNVRIDIRLQLRDVSYTHVVMALVSSPHR